jgi:hypothetical protein
MIESEEVWSGVVVIIGIRATLLIQGANFTQNLAKGKPKKLL